jgi:ketosteroid isomerase-like protein
MRQSAFNLKEVNMATNDTAAVTEAVEGMRKAMAPGDKAALEKLTADELVYGHSSGRLENKAQFIDTLTNGKGGFTAVEVSDQTVNIVDNIALVRHVFNGTRRNAPSGDEKMKLSVLTVWLKRKDQWKLVARQAAKL